jgi:hypothetical protein
MTSHSIEVIFASPITALSFATEFTPCAQVDGKELLLFTLVHGHEGVEQSTSFCMMVTYSVWVAVLGALGDAKEMQTP